jgi:hypothetical protein
MVVMLNILIGQVIIYDVEEISVIDPQRYAVF